MPVDYHVYRFSPFVKTGTEGFILGSMSLKRDPRATEIVKIVVSGSKMFRYFVCTWVHDFRFTVNEMQSLYLTWYPCIKYFHFFD